MAAVTSPSIVLYSNMAAVTSLSIVLYTNMAAVTSRENRELILVVDFFTVDDSREIPDAVPISPPEKNKKIRTWGPSSVHQRDRDKSRRSKARDSFLAERSNSVPNLNTAVNQNTGNVGRMRSRLVPC